MVKVKRYEVEIPEGEEESWEEALNSFANEVYPVTLREIKTEEE